MPANNPSYFELLRRPEWQKKRLKIMERDGFKCQMCRAADITLNVHHSYYTKGAKPWEYPDESLQCLCEPCHTFRHKQLAEVKALVGPLGSMELDVLIGFLKASALERTYCEPGGEDSLTIEMTRKSAYAQMIGVCLCHADTEALEGSMMPRIDRGDGRLSRASIRVAIEESAGRSRPLEATDGR